MYVRIIRVGQKGNNSVSEHGLRPTVVEALIEKEVKVKRVFCGDCHIAVQCTDASWYAWGHDSHKQISGMCQCGACPVRSTKLRAILKPHWIRLRCGIRDEDVVDMVLGYKRSMIVVYSGALR